jgi:hypothetical protein
MVSPSKKRKRNGDATSQESQLKISFASSTNGTVTWEESQQDSQEAKLCATCSQIDFDSVFSNESAKEGKVLFELDPPNILKNSVCSFCRLLADIILTWMQNKDDEQRYFYLGVLPSLANIGEPNYSSTPRQLSAAKIRNTSVLAIVQNHENSQHSRIMVNGTRIGFVSPTSLSSLQRTPHVTFREIDLDEYNAHLAREWLQYCQNHHITTCTSDRHRIRSKFRLIDCAAKSIVKAPTHSAYAALSYVWGPHEKNSQEDGSTENSTGLPEDMPQVIEDAIRVALGLRLNYLWVDRYV